MNFIEDSSIEASAFGKQVQKYYRKSAFFKVEPVLTSEDFESDHTGLLDAIAKRNGLREIGASWKEVTEKTATWFATNLLNMDMAYHAELFPRGDASRLSHEFIQYVSQGETIAKTGKGCRYFINGEMWTDAPSIYRINREEILGWTPVTEATFDCCIIMLTPSQIGILWGENED